MWSRSTIYGTTFIAAAIICAPAAKAVDQKTSGYNWSGIYLGAQVGAQWSDFKFDDLKIEGPTRDIPWNVRPIVKPSGSIVGGHIGYNHQFGQWVLGAELSLDVGDVTGSAWAPRDASVSADAQDDIFDAKSKFAFQGVLRLGYAINRSLVYGKLGYASTKVAVAIKDTAGTNNGGSYAVSAGEQHNGIIVGGGWQYQLSQNTIFGIDYFFFEFPVKAA